MLARHNTPLLGAAGTYLVVHGCPEPHQQNNLQQAAEEDTGAFARTGVELMEERKRQVGQMI